jgi:fumarate reductase flavoprotein subunit
MPVIIDDARHFDIRVPVVIVGAGACGLVAALAAKARGADVLVLERDRAPSGSTALSSGFIPAAPTRFQRAAGVTDTAAQFADDIQRKNHGEADPAMVDTICRASGLALEWLADRCGIPFVLVDGFLYPGHSALRMHAVPERTGRGLMAALQGACERAGIDLLTGAAVTTLFADSTRRVTGVAIERPGGSVEELGCAELVLACSGFGGNADKVRQHIPELAGVDYFGHAGNRGDALDWGSALGAAAVDLGAYQGHGSVASPHGVLITWALMMGGGIQVNVRGERFSNEHDGYSEQCIRVLQQPGRVAWNVYDARLHALGLAFDDYRAAVDAGAIRSAPDFDALATTIGVPSEALRSTLDEVRRCARGEVADRFGRDFTTQPALQPPWYAVKVTGALFHTQGGLVVDSRARVCDAAGRSLPNLYAGGGAARGVSGAHVWGYLSGNGLLTAVTLGWIAGRAAAAAWRESGAGRESPDQP